MVFTRQKKWRLVSALIFFSNLKLNLMNKLLKAIFLFSIFTYTVNVKAGDKNLAKYRVVFHSSSAGQNHCGHLVADGSKQ